MRSILQSFPVMLVLLMPACADSPTAAPAEVAEAALPPDSGVLASTDPCGGSRGCTLDPVLVEVPQSEPSTCEAWNWDHTCDPSDGTDTGGAPGGDGGTDGGGESDPWGGAGEDQPPPDTCNTNDPIIEDEDVKRVFAELVAASNWNAFSQSERREVGGWIVSDGQGGYAVQPFNTVNPQACGIGFQELIPANAVGVVHTHPWRLGETVTSCGARRDGSYPRYRGNASSTDLRVIQGLAAARPNVSFRGYILDKSGISTYSATTRPSPTDGGGRDGRYGTCY